MGYVVADMWLDSGELCGALCGKNLPVKGEAVCHKGADILRHSQLC